MKYYRIYLWGQVPQSRSKLNFWLIGFLLLMVACSRPTETQRTFSDLDQLTIEQRLTGIWFYRTETSTNYIHLTPRENTPYMNTLFISVNAQDYPAERVMAIAYPFEVGDKLFLKFHQILLFGDKWSQNLPLGELGIEASFFHPTVIELPGYWVLHVTKLIGDSLHLRLMDSEFLKKMMEERQIGTDLNPNIIEHFGLLDLSERELIDVLREAPLNKLFPEDKEDCGWDCFLEPTRNYSWDRISSEPMDTGHSNFGVYRVIALTDVADIQVEGGDLDGARITTSLAMEAAAYSNDTGFPFSNIAELQAKTGEIEKALETAARIPPGSWERNAAFAYIAVAQANNDDVLGALNTVQKYTEEWSRMSAFTKIAVVQNRHGDDVGSDQTLKMAKDSALKMESYGESARALRFIAEEQFRMGDQPGAVETASMAQEYLMSEAESCPFPLVDIANLQADLGDKTAALKNAKLVMGCLDNLKSLSSRFRTIAGCSGIIVRAGEKARVITTARKTIDMKLFSQHSYQCSDNKDIVRMLSDLADIKSKEGEYMISDEVAGIAQDYAKHLKTDSCREPVLVVMALAKARAGNIPEALKILKGLKWDFWPFRETMGKIAAMQFKRGDEDGAEKTVSLAIGSEVFHDFRGKDGAETALNPVLEASMFHELRRLAKTMVENGYYEGAKQVLLAARSLIEDQDHYLRAVLLCEIAEIQLQAGDKTGARRTARVAFEDARNVSLLE